jgi:catechol 2,3-dioxygenase-like lactoylglutathione lyase family enzyme
VSLAHLTLATCDVERTAVFFERTLGYTRDPVPSNVMHGAVWLNVGGGQQIHLVHVDGFEVSPFEDEFGRHVAVYYPLQDFEGLKGRLTGDGAQVVPPLRSTSFDRFFFREPINGYVFEIIDDEQAKIR